MIRKNLLVIFSENREVNEIPSKYFFVRRKMNSYQWYSFKRIPSNDDFLFPVSKSLFQMVVDSFLLLCVCYYQINLVKNKQPYNPLDVDSAYAG